MDKEIVMYTYLGILFNFKMKEIMLLVTKWMTMEDIILCEVSQS